MPDPHQFDPAAVPELANLLHEAEAHHGPFEETHEKHNWWDWYAAYMVARQRGSDFEQASADANRYLEHDLHIRPL